MVDASRLAIPLQISYDVPKGGAERTEVIEFRYSYFYIDGSAGVR